MMRKKITVCADDYGLSDGVDEAIITLANNGKISAISCLAVLDRWKLSGRRLQNLRNVQTGLHLSFSSLPSLTKFSTLARNHTMPSWQWVLASSYLRLADKEEIKKEIQAQIDSFTSVVGRTPDFIDGHQHLHQCPGISEALLEVMIERGWNKSCWLRNSSQASISHWKEPKLLMKRAILDFLGRNFKEKIRSHGCRTNSTLSGIYLLKEQFYDENFYHRLLWEVEDEGVLICHPSMNDEDLQGLDDYKVGRHKEFEILNSFHYPEEIELK